MSNKIGTTFLCMVFSCLALCAQSIVDDQVQSLQTEIETLKSINQKLRREFDSLLGIKNNRLPSGYYVRLNGGFVGYDGVTYRILTEQVRGKLVYSIASFFNVEEAYSMAKALRKLNLNDVEIVKIGITSSLNPQPNRKKISQTMEIID